MLTQTALIPSLWASAAAEACAANPLALLRYRSNLLGADLRITNFGGGNTSSKYEAVDPKTGRAARVMAVKGSGTILALTRTASSNLLRAPAAR